MHGSSDTEHEGSWWCERLEGEMEADDWLWPRMEETTHRKRRRTKNKEDDQSNKSIQPTVMSD